jgi:hypothetical protein
MTLLVQLIISAIEDRILGAAALSDWLCDRGDEDLANRVRTNGALTLVADILTAHGGQDERRLAKLALAVVRDGIQRAWNRRTERRDLAEGDTDARGRWRPSERERSGRILRQPPGDWMYTALAQCSTREHVAHLIQRGLQGMEGPDDITVTVSGIRVATLQLLKGGDA